MPAGERSRSSAGMPMHRGIDPDRRRPRFTERAECAGTATLRFAALTAT